MKTERLLKNLALIGFMGTGKSSVGREAALELGFDFLDTDILLEERAGKSVSEIFAQEGQKAFREYERELVSELGLETKQPIFKKWKGFEP